MKAHFNPQANPRQCSSQRKSKTVSKSQLVCVMCSQSFQGRTQAKTCSPPCSIELQRANKQDRIDREYLSRMGKII